MFYADTDGRRLLARERTELLSSEMRRVRRLTREQAGYPRWARLTSELLARLERRRQGHRLPACDA